MKLRRRGAAPGGTDAGASTPDDAPAEPAGKAARKPLTAAQAKRLIGIGKVVAPLLAPYAIAAAGAARARWDAYRAAQLGVDPGQLATYSGRGGALHARVSQVARSLDDLEAGAAADTQGSDRSAGPRFAAAVRPRLTDLSIAIRAAEQMPTARRRAAHRAVAADLDRIERELLHHLGIPT